ncbi:unnamed protein product [Schistosoma bovis]|nr:unnamed protein product [Schistosoma bovis]
MSNLSHIVLPVILCLLDPIQRHNLEREVDDLWLIISDYKTNPEVIAEQDKKRNVTIRNEDATYDHLKTLTNMEVQRIDVLELLSLEERIKIYESIMQEERNQKNERNFNQTKYCSQTVLIKILSTFSLTEKPKNSINVHFIPVSFR